MGEKRFSEKHINKSNLVKLRMVQALITLDMNTNRVLNMVKAKFGLKDKSATIKFLVDEYIENQEEPELRPEFIEKMKSIEKEKTIRVKDFAKHYGLKD